MPSDVRLKPWNFFSGGSIRKGFAKLKAKGNDSEKDRDKRKRGAVWSEMELKRLQGVGSGKGVNRQSAQGGEGSLIQKVL